MDLWPLFLIPVLFVALMGGVLYARDLRRGWLAKQQLRRREELRRSADFREEQRRRHRPTPIAEARASNDQLPPG